MSFQTWLQGFEGPQVEAGPDRIGGAANTYEFTAGDAFAEMMDDYKKSTMSSQAYSNWKNQSANRGGGTSVGGFGGFAKSLAGAIYKSKKQPDGYDVDPSYYMDLQQQFGDAKSFMMDQTGAGGYLADSSMNPYARQLGAQHMMAQQAQQRDLGYGMAAMGANPFMAQQQMMAGQFGANMGYADSMAQLEADLVARRYGAGQELLNLSGALGSEMTARKEEQYRWGQDALREKELGKMSASAAKSAGRSSMMGSIIGGGIAALSDRRRKKDIKKLHDDPRGFGVYEFSYKWEDERRTGVMADEVKKVIPDAVFECGGTDYMAVDYSRL